jgi:hypothetical protein
MNRVQHWIDATFFAYYATMGGVQQNAVYYTPWMPLQHIGYTMQLTEGLFDAARLDIQCNAGEYIDAAEIQQSM